MKPLGFSLEATHEVMEMIESLAVATDFQRQQLYVRLGGGKCPLVLMSRR